jgi:lipid-binding SYLF domain-containing protein
MKTTKSYIVLLLIAVGCLALSLSPFVASTSSARSKTPQEINSQVDSALVLFSHQVRGGKELLNSAKGVLVIPNVVKAGLGLGGEYGEGALRVHGKTVAYYNIAGGSMGFEIGAEKKDLILVFMQEGALDHFRRSSDWTAGFDAAVTVIDSGKEGYTDTEAMNAPVIAFVFGQKGLMFDASIEGTKFSRMDKSNEMVGRR